MIIREQVGQRVILPFRSSSGQHMSIQTNPENTERIRDRLRKISNLELRKFGRAGRAEPPRRRW
jgi:hypothetical protein